MYIQFSVFQFLFVRYVTFHSKSNDSFPYTLPSYPILGIRPPCPADVPAEYPYKNSNNRKNKKRAGDEGKRALPPFHRAPRALFFFLPSLPTSQRGLYEGDRVSAY